MNIKNKRKHQYKRIGRENNNAWMEYKLMYGEITKLQLKPKEIVLSQLITEIANGNNK